MVPVHAVAILTLVSMAGTVPRPFKTANTHVPASFAVRVAEYVELHRYVVDGIGYSTLCADPEELARQAAELAAAVRASRPFAREGDIFTTEVAAAFRTRITLAVRPSPGDVTRAGTDDEFVRVEVNATLPPGVGRPAWPAVFNALPDLPAELEYRFVGRTLVLLDADANLVVDLLREALPAPRVEPPSGSS
jgi:hypothetical protein